MKEWTKSDVDRLQGKPSKPKKRKAKFSKEKNHIEMMLLLLKKQGHIKDYCQELKFSDSRRFRFDWAIKERKIGIEYEGIFANKSRHTSVKGFSKDCEKYNLAQIEGWTVLRYTALNFKEVYNDIIKLLAEQ